MILQEPGTCIQFIKNKRGQSTWYSLRTSNDSRTISNSAPVNTEFKNNNLRTKRTSLYCNDNHNIEYGVRAAITRYVETIEEDILQNADPPIADVIR